MSTANSLSEAPPHVPAADRLEHFGVIALAGVAAALQFSIAIAQSLLLIAIVCWIALVLVRHERVEVPLFFWPLAVLAGLTLLSAAFSPQPRISLVDTKQLVLLLIVMVLDLLAMLYARQILVGPTIIVLQVLGAVLALPGPLLAQTPSHPTDNSAQFPSSQDLKALTTSGSYLAARHASVERDATSA